MPSFTPIERWAWRRIKDGLEDAELEEVIHKLWDSGTKVGAMSATLAKTRILQDQVARLEGLTEAQHSAIEALETEITGLRAFKSKRTPEGHL